MRETNHVEQEITVHGELCKVIAHKTGKRWRASGYVGTKYVQSQAASTSSKAFEYWRKKAEMREWD